MHKYLGLKPWHWYWWWQQFITNYEKKTKNPSEPTFKLTPDLEHFALFEVQSIYPKHKKHLSSFNEADSVLSHPENQGYTTQY